MKLIKINTKHTAEDVKNLDLTNIQIDMMKRVFDNIEYVEFIDKKGFASIFCITSDYNLKRLADLYISLSVSFSITDLTKNVLLSDKVETSYEDEDGIDVSSSITKLVNGFYKDYITVNDVLDKINIKGILSLNKFDRLVLENV